MKNSKKAILPHLWKFWLVILCVNASYSFGQDTLIKKSGEEIICHVKEISPTEIRYTKMELENGPVYIEDRFSVEKIKYKNGFVEVFPVVEPWKIPLAKPKPKEEELKSVEYKPKPVLKKFHLGYMYWDKYVGEREMQNIALGLKDPVINEEVKAARQAKGLQYVGFLAIPIMIGCASYNINHVGTAVNGNKDSQNTNLAFLATSAIVVGASIHFKIERKKRNAHIVELYNQHYQ